MALPSWLTTLFTIGITALEFSPLAPIASIVAGAIATAESIPGMTGQQKLGAALQLVTDGAQIAQARGVKIDPTVVATAGADAIAAGVLITNIVSGTKTVPAAIATLSTTVA